MEVVNKKLLEKLKRKSNKLLVSAIDNLLAEFKAANWKNKNDLIKDRPDADQVHNDGFFIFNINVHRTMILIEFEESGEAIIVWCGSHNEYELIFKNNKNTIKKWLKSKGWID